MKRIYFIFGVLSVLLMANDSPDFAPDFRINALGVAILVTLLASSAQVRGKVKAAFQTIASHLKTYRYVDQKKTLQ